MFLSVIGRRAAWALFLIALISPAARATDPPRAHKHFLWRVTNAPAPFYLVGSMHALRGSDYPLDPKFEQVVANSRKIIFETNPQSPNAWQFRSKLFAAGYYPYGVTVEQKLGPDTFALLKRIARVRLSEYYNRKPWAIAYFMVDNPETRNFSTRLGMDRYIYRKSRARLEIGGLETTEEFIRAFSGMSDAESEAFLIESIAYARRSPQLLVETIEAWKNGDTQRMYRLYSPRRSTRSSYWRWIERRHATWLPRIEEAIRSGKPTVVVAGALHFSGPSSVIAMLKAHGYQVEQL